MSAIPIRRPAESPLSDFARPRSQVVTFTPGMAREVLDARNEHNRHLSRSHVAKLAESLRSGLWQLNGEPIIFGSGGQLLDGQHRLAACAEAGVPLTSWVVFGVPPESFETIDRGKARTNSDDLGIRGEKNRLLLAATLALVWLEEQGRPEQIGVTPPSPVCHQVLERHPDVRPYVDWVMSSKLRRFLNPRVAAYCYYRFAQKDKAAADEFFAQLETGADLTAGDPVLMLRARILQESASKSKLKVAETMALVIKAWNHRRAGQTIRFLRWRADGPNPESFPEIA